MKWGPQIGVKYLSIQVAGAAREIVLEWVGAEGSVFFVLLKTLAASEKRKPFRNCMQIRAARKFPALVSWPYYYPLYRESKREGERVGESSPCSTFNGVFIYIFSCTHFYHFRYFFSCLVSSSLPIYVGALLVTRNLS